MRSHVLLTIGVSIIVGALLLSIAATACAQADPPTPTPVPTATRVPTSTVTVAPEIITATTEARWALQTAVVGKMRIAKATREAKQAATATFRADNPPSPTPSPPPAIIPSGLLNDIQAVTWHMEALNPIIARCVARGDIDGREHAPFFDTAGTVMLDISEDAADGILDYYDEKYIRQFTQDIHAKLDELERQCMR